MTFGHLDTWGQYQAEYLARMGRTAPDVVTETFERMEVGDNHCVHWDILRAALQMPAAYAVRLARIETEWLAKRDRVLVPRASEYGELAAKLAAEGEADSALALVRVLFEPLGEGGRSGSGFMESRGRLEWYGYEEVLPQTLPKLVEALADRVLGLLCDLLEQTIVLTRGPDYPDAPRDLSELWRPAVEDHFQNHPHRLADALTIAIRDAAIRLAAESPADRAEVVQSLEQRPWDIFHRVAMHVICEAGAPALDLARPRILNRARFDNVAYRHEYARLLRVFFDKLDAPEQGVILGWIDEGPPDLGAWGERWKRELGRDLSEPEIGRAHV
jgi:hypothetical protein